MILFTVVYTDNLNVGTAKVIITGKGNYKGTITKRFKINKAENTLKVEGNTVKVKRSSKKKSIKRAKVITILDAGQGELTYKKIAGNGKITINSKSGKVTIKKKGAKKKKTYKVTVRVTAAGNSTTLSKYKDVEFRIKIK